MVRKFAVELGEQRDAVDEAKLGAGGGERGVSAGVAPLTMKLVPSSAWNAAASAGLLTQSCAQASRARKVSTALRSNAATWSKRVPNSCRRRSRRSRCCCEYGASLAHRAEYAVLRRHQFGLESL